MNKKALKIFKPFLWSYDVPKMDLERDKKRIITNVLNFGTKDATDFLFKTFDKKEIIELVKNPIPGEMSKKSLNYWALVLNVNPGKLKRKIS